MVNEITKITIDTGKAAEFELAVERCAEVIKKTPGCHGLSLEREIEDMANYYMQVKWESVEAHRRIGAGEAARLWAETVVPFYQTASVVVHTNPVAIFF